MHKPLSLFSHVLLTVLVATLAVLSVFAVLFYVDRNRAIAELSAQLMVPALRQALGLTGPAAPLPVAYRSADRPLLAMDASTGVPRFRVLSQELTRQGIDILDMVYTREDDRLVLWLKLPHPTEGTQWLGFADRILEPAFPRRALAGWALALLLLLGASAALAWHLSHPLATLQHRMEAAFRPGWERSSLEFTAQPPGRRRWLRPAREILAIEQAFDRLCTQLMRQERERELMLAGISHDLRSPLARIRTAAELLPTHPGTAMRQTSIVRNVEMADNLLEALLNQVRQNTLRKNETLNIGNVVRDVMDQYADIKPEILTTVAHRVILEGSHPLLIEQLISNLVDNALRHGKPPVSVSVSATPDTALISVSDHGNGFAPEDWQRLSQAFAKGDRARRSAGVGLGLTIVQQSVSRLAGTVTVSRGTDIFEIRIALPLVKRQSTDKAGRVARASPLASAHDKTDY